MCLVNSSFFLSQIFHYTQIIKNQIHTVGLTRMDQMTHQNILIFFAEEHINFQLKLDILDGALSLEQGCDASLISTSLVDQTLKHSLHIIYLLKEKSTKEDKYLLWKVLILFVFAPLRWLD